MNTQKIYVVIEIGAGEIKSSFLHREHAEEEVKDLEECTGLNCYEIQEVNLFS